MDFTLFCEQVTLNILNRQQSYFSILQLVFFSLHMGNFHVICMYILIWILSSCLVVQCTKYSHLLPPWRPFLGLCVNFTSLPYKKLSAVATHILYENVHKTCVAFPSLDLLKRRNWKVGTYMYGRGYEGFHSGGGEIFKRENYTKGEVFQTALEQNFKYFVEIFV